MFRSEITETKIPVLQHAERGAIYYVNYLSEIERLFKFVHRFIAHAFRFKTHGFCILINLRRLNKHIDFIESLKRIIAYGNITVNITELV